MIQAGKLRHRAELQEQVTTSDGAGGSSTDWIRERQIWCDIRPLKSDQRLENMRRETSTTHIITARFRDDIDTKKRILFDDRPFNIDGVINEDERGSRVTMFATEGVAT